MRSRPADAMKLDFQCAIDSGFHVVPAGLGHADPGADGDSVTNVRFPKDWGTQDRGHQATWQCAETMSPREFPGRGMAHGKQARAGNTGPLTPGLLALTMTAIPYLAAE